MHWPPADVHRIADHRDVVLQQISRKAADDPTDQHHQGNRILMEPDGIREAFHRKRAERIHLLVAGAMSLMSGVYKFLWRIELGHQSIARTKAGGFAHRCTSSASCT